MSRLPYLRKGWQQEGTPGVFFLKEKEGLLCPQVPTRWYLGRHRPPKAVYGLESGSVCSPTSQQVALV